MKQENRLALIIAYYLSKFDKVAYKNLNWGGTIETHQAIGQKLDVNPNTIKNMRDEFDPLHDNPRKGWYQRKLSVSRQDVIDQFSSHSELEMLEVVLDILGPASGKQAIFSSVEEEEISEADKKYIEGETIERKVLSYKRNRRSVVKCKKQDGYTCQSCAFWYEDKIVECHHLEPLYMIKDSIVSQDNLVTLCPTCHRLAHVLINQNYELYTKRDELLSKLSEILSS